MSLASNKIILANASTNTAGAYFQVVTVNASNTVVGTTIPAGLYFVPNTANVTIQFNTTSNVSNVVYSTANLVTALANNTAGLVWSDGTNVLANSAYGNITVTLYTVNGGANVSGTYNAT